MQAGGEEFATQAVLRDRFALRANVPHDATTGGTSTPRQPRFVALASALTARGAVLCRTCPVALSRPPPAARRG
ncbi:MAG: hypothetical protein AVDCRST_MAG19-3617 [uncultured Thermomicrobiales bacterium]|uniref:Uncharacterized protein n=1 Tax=uncultured Thermomicrobiales bacterium TaxID=1645740 RepID=A0A6J4VH00_9BACT|nr:MAG: hypothetical protein AVDCRST_MAG19-3617 [uncultured Thermomicrobiales bacterium]